MLVAVRVMVRVNNPRIIDPLYCRPIIECHLSGLPCNAPVSLCRLVASVGKQVPVYYGSGTVAVTASQSYHVCAAG